MGTDRANPPRLEVGRRIVGSENEQGIRPGLPSTTADREARTAVAFAALLACLAAAAHWFVYASGGSHYLGLLDWLRQAD